MRYEEAFKTGCRAVCQEEQKTNGEIRENMMAKKTSKGGRPIRQNRNKWRNEKYEEHGRIQYRWIEVK